MQTITRILVFLALITICCLPAAWAAGPEGGQGGAVPEAPVKGMVTMLDLGADKCIPCKMMAPIVEQLAEDYKGRAAIVFIDVWKNPGQAGRFGVSAIPTQIFFDASGTERHRHVGFMDKPDIEKILAELGVK